MSATNDNGISIATGIINGDRKSITGSLLTQLKYQPKRSKLVRVPAYTTPKPPYALLWSAALVPMLLQPVNCNMNTTIIRQVLDFIKIQNISTRF